MASMPAVGHPPAADTDDGVLSDSSDGPEYLAAPPGMIPGTDWADALLVGDTAAGSSQPTETDRATGGVEEGGNGAYDDDDARSDCSSSSGSVCLMPLDPNLDLATVLAARTAVAFDAPGEGPSGPLQAEPVAAPSAVAIPVADEGQAISAERDVRAPDDASAEAAVAEIPSGRRVQSRRRPKPLVRSTNWAADSEWSLGPRIGRGRDKGPFVRSEQGTNAFLDGLEGSSGSTTGSSGAGGSIVQSLREETPRPWLPMLRGKTDPEAERDLVASSSVRTVQVGESMRTLLFVGYAASQGNDGSGGVEVWDVTPVAGADGEAMLLLSVANNETYPMCAVLPPAPGHSAAPEFVAVEGTHREAVLIDAAGEQFGTFRVCADADGNESTIYGIAGSAEVIALATGRQHGGESAYAVDVFSRRRGRSKHHRHSKRSRSAHPLIRTLATGPNPQGALAIGDAWLAVPFGGSMPGVITPAVNAVEVISLDSGARVALFETGVNDAAVDIRHLSFSPDGAMLAVSFVGRPVRVFAILPDPGPTATGTARLLYVLAGTSGPLVKDVGWAPDSRWIFVSTSAGTCAHPINPSLGGYPTQWTHGGRRPGALAGVCLAEEPLSTAADPLVLDAGPNSTVRFRATKVGSRRVAVAPASSGVSVISSPGPLGTDGLALVAAPNGDLIPVSFRAAACGVDRHLRLRPVDAVVAEVDHGLICPAVRTAGERRSYASRPRLDPFDGRPPPTITGDVLGSPLPRASWAPVAPLCALPLVQVFSIRDTAAAPGGASPQGRASLALAQHHPPVVRSANDRVRRAIETRLLGGEAGGGADGDPSEVSLRVAAALAASGHTPAP